MGTRIIMPSGGQTTNDMLVTAWHKKVGDAVKRGDVLFSIETDKATMDVESYGEGTLLAIYHEAEETVGVGELMAYVGRAGEQVPAADGGAQPASPAAPAHAADNEEDEYAPIPAARRTASAQKTEAQALPPAPSGPSGLLTASPAARKAAKDAGIPIAAVAQETGRQPVKRSDVLRALERSDAPEGEFAVVEASPMRKAIARRMLESVAAAPQYTVSVDVDMENAVSLREKLNARLKKEGVRVSYNDIIMKCACAAISKHPMINASFEGGRIKVYKQVHFGLAVGLEGGLVVPVVRGAQGKAIAQLAAENAANVEKARTGRLQQADMTGGTITLSNLGMYGIARFTAILNSPEACILAAGGILEKPVVKNGALAAGHVMSLTATFDHRIIDGAEGAAFLSDLKDLLENPDLLLL